MFEALKQRMKLKWANFLIKQVFIAVSPHEILQMRDGVYYFNGRAISRDDMDRLKYDVERLEKSLLWRMLCKEYRYRASDLIVYKSKSTNDIIFGKALLYWVEVSEDLFKLINRS